MWISISQSRYLRHLLWCQALFFFLIGSNIAEAQQQDSYNSNYFKFSGKDVYFGMNLGFTSVGFKTFNSEKLLETSDFTQIYGKNGAGFRVHVITNLKVGEFFDLRFTPGFAFAERSLVFERQNEIALEESFESVFFEFPFQLRFKSKPYKDMRLFLLTGINYSWDVASNTRVDAEETILRVSPTDFQVEVGGGFQLFTPFFIFSPEIKFSHGLQNIFIFDSELVESDNIFKILSRSFSLSINLEG